MAAQEPRSSQAEEGDRRAASSSLPVRILAPLLLVAFGSLLGVVLLEVGLRVAVPTAHVYHIWPPHLRMTFQIDPESRLGIEGSRHFHVNSQGLRADELGPEHEVRVLAFGGSTTECLILDQKEAWPHLVQEILGGPPGSRPVWVGNAGVSGRGSREHVFQVPRLLASYPETDVALVLVGVNDLGMRLQQDDEYDPRFLERENVEDEMIPRAFAHYPLEFRSSLPYHKRLELYARLRHLKNYVMMVLPDRGEVQNASGSNIARWRENRRNATRIRMQLPDLAESLAEYRRNLMRIAASAREAGVPLVFITQPSLWRSDLPDEERALLWWGGVGEFMAEGARTEFYSVEALAEGMHRYNRVLLSVCQESGAHCLDLASLLPKDTTVFYDGVHFHEAGARRVAALVSECVAEVLEAPAEAGVCGAARY